MFRLQKVAMITKQTIGFAAMLLLASACVNHKNHSEIAYADVWEDLEINHPIDKLRHLSSRSSLTDFMGILGQPDQKNIEGNVRNYYWISGSRKPDETPGREPSYLVTYAIIRLAVFSETQRCTIQYYDYIGRDKTPNPFEMKPVTAKEKPCDFNI